MVPLASMKTKIIYVLIYFIFPPFDFCLMNVLSLHSGVNLSLTLSHTNQVLTKDSVTVSVDAVVYYRVSNATVSVANVENAHHSTRLLAQTTLRNILGTKNLHEILSDRDSISGSMQVQITFYCQALRVPMNFNFCQTIIHQIYATLFIF